MAMIQKALITGFGDESKITVVQEEIPAPSANEVQVEVEFSGFSGADINMRRGTYPMQKKPPFTPGYCFVGRVTANGPRSTKFRIGTRVACLSIYGAEAELINVPEKYLVSVAEGVDSQQATAVILDWSTAYGMVMRAAHVEAGHKVFVHGLSGAVGYALFTLAKMQGATVYGTASGRKHPELVQAGATPYAYSGKEWISAMQATGGMDAVFDPLGFESWDEFYSILRKGGVLVGYGLNLPALSGTAPRPALPAVIKLLARNLMFWTGKRTKFYFISRDSKHYLSDLEALFDLLRTGRLSVPIKAVIPLRNIQRAHREWSQGAGIGSILIQVRE
jgi:NADPH:quinone reductase-like Zn-dependent oxidoreductase